jgi:hypothetical protein
MQVEIVPIREGGRKVRANTRYLTLAWSYTVSNYLVGRGIDSPLLSYMFCRKNSHDWKSRPLGNRDRTFLLSDLREGRAVVSFFTLKDLSPHDIYTEIESVSMDETLCLCTIHKWYGHFMQERTRLFDDRRSGPLFRNGLADSLRAMIQNFLFTSRKRLCTRFRLAGRICFGILFNVLHFKKFNLWWVGHSLDNGQNAERMSFSTDLLKILKEDQANDFAQVITGDESWFHSDCLCELVWVPPRDDVPERIK